MPHFANPAEGSWTDHCPALGAAALSYEDSISSTSCEPERDAVFSGTRLTAGRVVEQVARGRSAAQRSTTRLDGDCGRIRL